MSNRPSKAEIKEASLNPNGWVYKIDGEYSNDEDVPFESIIGWWKVDSQGQIIGDFAQNPKYKPKNARA